MPRRLAFDVYGRMRIVAEQSARGQWVLYRTTGPGRRRPITDVVVPDGATIDDVIELLEAAYHEYGRPGRDILLIE